MDPDNENVRILVFPGNTKKQGDSIFTKGGEPSFKDAIEINGTRFRVSKKYHIKLTSFQKLFVGLWADKKDFSTPLYTRDTFLKYSGRKERKTGSWEKIEKLFDKHFQ